MRRNHIIFLQLLIVTSLFSQELTLKPGSIMVTGGSYGGHMTLVISTFFSDKIPCAVDVVGMSNLVTFLEHTERLPARSAAC